MDVRKHTETFHLLAVMFKIVSACIGYMMLRCFRKSSWSWGVPVTKITMKNKFMIEITKKSNALYLRKTRYSAASLPHSL